MKFVVWWLIAFAALALESPLLVSWESFFYAPDVALIMALYIGSRAEPLGGLVTAFAIGLLKDGFCLAAPVGVFTEITVLTFLVARLLSRRVDLRSSVPLMATTAAASLVASALFLALEAIFHRSSSDYGQVLRLALPLALVTMLLAPIQFGLLERVGRTLSNRGGGRYLFP